MKDRQKASVIIPVWNGAEVVLDALAAVFANSDEWLLEVICVDNASQDQSAALIETHYPQVKLLKQVVNLGFAGGVNVGLKAAQGDILVLLNSLDDYAVFVGQLLSGWRRVRVGS